MGGRDTRQEESRLQTPVGGAGPWGGALARGWGFVRRLKGLGPLRTELGESAEGLAMPVKGRWRRRGVGGVCVCD